MKRGGASKNTSSLHVTLYIFVVLANRYYSSWFTDFRPRGLFSAFRTEVLLHGRLLTSVPEALFQGFGRKFCSLDACRLPSPRPFFRVLDGSFTPCALADFRPWGPFSGFWTEVFAPWTLADFRPRGPFSGFWTEVLLHGRLPTSVPEARFQHLGRKSIIHKEKGTCILCSSQLIISSS